MYITYPENGTVSVSVFKTQGLDFHSIPLFLLLAAEQVTEQNMYTFPFSEIQSQGKAADEKVLKVGFYFFFSTWTHALYNNMHNAMYETYKSFITEMETRDSNSSQQETISVVHVM